MTDNSHFPFLPRFIATSFGAGYWPYGPGTAGAVVGLILWLPLVLTGHVTGTFLATLGLILVFTVLGIWSAGVAEQHWGPDPSRVVMDETVGQWITMLPLSVFAGQPDALTSGKFWLWAVISLILFRFFDIVKPLGVRKMEDLPGGTGIMADDILAGIYGEVILALAMYFFF
ncbi:MAG: phosphatidylglycerophosphatase A [Duncaniella sp.]|uniref:phosphatidylglycerophosphatase A family protein n=1 Tax=Duncaniella sp. TaxID=2518496 RepID=UPI0023D5BB73|nr:phosphatidylglycerophosphatase A [Duncaniella sp.]MDE5988082.1 phosphatidylglycerophosphatase A [Duncaniella sp.]MDE6174650.1 phosphatidylglycerophosphatase A [Duncaniella sp.]